MQQELVAGDSLNFLTTVKDYPAGDDWELHFRLVPRTSTNVAIELEAVAEGDDFRTAVAASTTAGWAADSYTWVSWVEKTGESYSVESGQIVVKPNPRTVAPGYDGRSGAAKALDDARAALYSFNPTRKRYKIGEREMEFNSTAEIVKHISFLEQQVAKEDVLAGRVEKVGRRIYSRI